jgi:hypothetical protein
MLPPAVPKYIEGKRNTKRLIEQNSKCFKIRNFLAGCYPPRKMNLDPN